MLIHTVVFWLKKDLSQKDRKFFEIELKKLKNISPVDHLWIGIPSPTVKRPVIDDTYDFCLTVILKDLASHDRYQEDPIHLEFIEACSRMWERVVIYDAE